MLDCVVRNEGEPDVVQISGGEPTLHPELFAILDEAYARPIRTARVMAAEPKRLRTSSRVSQNHPPRHSYRAVPSRLASSPSPQATVAL